MKACGLRCRLFDILLTGSHSSNGSAGLESQIVSSTTYDGGISYNLMIENKDRICHAKAFVNIVNDSDLSYPQELLDLYGITTADNDPTALRKICQFESDIGFFAASLAQAKGFPGKSYLLLFDLGSPFEGFLPAGECATHTWDIVALLGSCEKWLEDDDRAAIADLRNRVLKFSVKGEEPWPGWTKDEGKAMVVGREGLSIVGLDEYMGANTRRGKLLNLAKMEAGEDGPDLLWSGVCRRFLMAGK